MNYKKGADVLPDRLLKEIQEYVEGCLVYIPKSTNKAGWGILSGTRQFIDKRNKNIKLLFEQGESIRNLSEQFHLGEDTIRKIVYKKK
ncbi:CD3324 family protein [Anaerocolumna sp. AGMB13025]|uniref:CD3324 family protein n=1 Tax=Anaerocolumna sp. AGMB13025 TaxID=3039116 RepID=UPI00241D4F8C|nr:CD3324 family protein [Anaerocolumna sp. AGMB13025]WFR55532.1 CD3324 family protein [Anaerocolumna sp. AGMB13025]